MSTSPAILDSPSNLAQHPSQSAAHRSMVRSLLGSTSALVVSMGLERGLGFLANLAAARIGGAAMFGAYSLGLTTANNIASYAGAGIGLTATRFSGQYAAGTASGKTLSRALILVSCFSALAATLLLFVTAEPLARILLHNSSLRHLLQWASLSAGTMILMECCRGYLIGQRRLSNLLCLSAVMGCTILVALPLASRLGPSAMIVSQAGAASLAIAAVMMVSRRTRSSSPSSLAHAKEETDEFSGQPSMSHMVRRIWNFGMVQLAGVVGLNAAGWWVASLVARSDQSLIQMGLFAVSNQLRNMVALVPGLLSQSSYAMMAGESAESTATSRILGFSTFTSTLFSILVGWTVILVLPFALPLLYGGAYRAGVPVACVAVATAVIHMSSAPASARLTIVSLRNSGYINAGWSLLVIALASALVPHYGALAAASIYLLAHSAGAMFVLNSLRRSNELPNGMISVTFLAIFASASMALLAYLRFSIPAWDGRLFGIAVALSFFVLGQLVWLGRNHGWMPRFSQIRQAAVSRFRRSRFA